MKIKGIVVTSMLALGVGLFILAQSGITAPPASASNNPKELLSKADKLFTDKNYADAATAYDTFLNAGDQHDGWQHASERTIQCKLRLQLYQDGLDTAEAYVKRAKGTYFEARAERLTGNLYMLIPHWGTRSGGDFHRGQWKQGIQVRSNNHDKAKAIGHLEKARDLYAKWDVVPDGKDTMAKADREKWHNERIECLFDLASTASRFGIYENSWTYWYNYWGERDDFLAETAGEDDFDEYHSDWQLRRKRPIGLRVDKNGNPIFPKTPKNYAKGLKDDQKILFLLNEARSLDQTENKHYTGLSYYRQAMLARSRFGMDRLNSYASMYYMGNKYPLKEELTEINPWELKDSEAIVLAGGQIKTVKLPQDWNIVSLLRTSFEDYKKSGVEGEAHYSLGLYLQSRQQYPTALKEYDEVNRRYAGQKWVANAATQIERIKRPQVRLSNSSVQLPGRPVELQVSHRNASKLFFVAREIDAKGFMNEVRAEKANPRYGFRGFHSLGNWHYHFVSGWHPQNWAQVIAAKHIKGEVIRWSDEVENDGSHRYTHSIKNAPLKSKGTYLIYAYLKDPPKNHAEKMGKDAMVIGDSRAVFGLSDVAIVEKKVKDGNLYMITGAERGEPIAKAQIEVMEVWSEYNRQQRKSIYHKQFHKLTTNENGLAVLKRQGNRGSRLHAMVHAGANQDRFAWTGMSYWSHYSPSRMRNGMFAYCITDRPVYRPGHSVKYKVWLRHMNNGVLENLPDQRIKITIYDARGAKLKEEELQTDQFGGANAELKIGEEPRLGAYRIQIQNLTDRSKHANYIGGQTFRIEEYKKPEFEVTVESGKNHAKLGEKVEALIKAKYFFGGPVTQATVKYKVFREEYTHAYHAPSRWDWLYGEGYGYGYYAADWFPWFGQMRCCIAPMWSGRRGNPVRELVAQGDGVISQDGTYAVEIDTTSAAKNHGDKDHRYVVTAEVRDSSRRVITGEGSVKATRQAYYTFVQPDRGYYRPGEEMFITVRCLTPGNQPVETEGVVTLSEVVFGGPNNAKINETQIDSYKLKTDERGIAKIQLRNEKSGQIKVKFTSPDSWGGEVGGVAMVWVVGRDFKGELHRFNNLELITDKRTYEPGEVAHVMVNTKHSDSHVLLSTDVDNNHLMAWNMVHIPGRSTVVDIPIKKNHAPNFFIEATTVFGTRTHQQSRRILVPPADGVIDVVVKTDKAEYLPGEKAHVFVEAKTIDGKPAQAQVTLSAFDQSVLYIAGENTPKIKKFFHGNVRHHRPMQQTNLVEQYAAQGHVNRPFQELWPYPQAWHGVWGPVVRDWRGISDKEMNGLAGRDGMLEDQQEGQGQAFGGEVGGLRQLSKSKASNSRGAFASNAVAEDSLAASPAPPGAPVAKMAKRGGRADPAGEKKDAGSGGDGGNGGLAEAEVRTKFADTALWLTTLTTGKDGTAKASFTMPDNLTTWKVNGWAMTKSTRVGQADTAVVSSKNLLVRLQAPRFFLEYDEVVVSAIVNNYLSQAKQAQVSVDIPKEHLQLIGDTKQKLTVLVPAGGEKRIDWRVKVLKEGTAKVLVKALTNEESDAMAMTFPVLVHGMSKQVATTGQMRPDDKNKSVTIELNIPKERRPELSRLEVQFSPSLVGSMLDALPYLLYYPYQNNEATVSRFMPAVLTLKTLQNMGINLEDVRKIRGKMEEIRRIEKGERTTIYGDHAIFDQRELDRIINNGRNKIANSQGNDGGWGWWRGGQSSGYFTSYILNALITAEQSDVPIDANSINRGINFLRNWEMREMRKKHWSVSSFHAFVAYTLSLKGQKVEYKAAKTDHDGEGKLIERLWKGRDKLPLYGKALLCLTLNNLKDKDRAKLQLTNIKQYLETNNETEVSWFRTPSSGWWYWWNNDIETNAWCLRCLTALEPKSDISPKIVKWLLNNRKNGYYWRSTRDTTMVLSAMSDFVVASGEGNANYELTLDFDNGKTVKKVKINKDNFFTYDNKFTIDGVTLGAGKHTLKITKNGPGALYYNTYLSYFTKEKDIKASGLELKVDRRYFKLEQFKYVVEVEGADGQVLKEERLRFKKVPVKNGDTLKSGDLVQVELEVTADNNYTYLAIEDPKPAGCEAVKQTSGGQGQEGFFSYMEMRDEKVALFMHRIDQGKHLLRYRLRAEVPGVFHALPTKFYAVYVPELKSNSNEHVIKIVD